MEDLMPPWDAVERTRQLQDAVREQDRDLLDEWVSDRMIWVLPEPANQRGKREWVDASCSVAWNWFEVRVLREVDLGSSRIVETWIRQQYSLPRDSESNADPATLTREGVVLDLWTLEDGDWRLVARHPQRAQE